jgi:hypothetical protein
VGSGYGCAQWGVAVAEPSVEWREVVGPDEAERHERQAAQLVELQARKSAQHGAGRALHRRQIAALRATLTVAAELPKYARQGIFAVPEKYDVWIRLSSGGFGRAPDRVPDIRGFALKVLGVSGQATLGGEAVAQDFTLINHDRFSSANSAEFTRLVTLGAESQGRILWTLVRTPSLITPARTILAARKAPFSGFATTDFFSAAPIAYGPYAVRVRLAAASDRVSPYAADDWAADLYDRLIGNPLTYDFQVQFFTDEQHTPIEDASVSWDAPYLTVGRLTVPRQKPDDAFAAEVDAAAFDPWNALTAHRPLGELMRARKVAYFASQQQRHAT